MKSDETLFLEFIEGKEQSLLELIQRYEKNLHVFLFRYLGDSHKAEDLFQETFVQIISKHASFDRSKTFRPWLFTIAANLARDELRKEKRRKTNKMTRYFHELPQEIHWEEIMDGAWQEPLLALEKSEQAHLLNLALKQLSPEHREVLILFHFEGLKYKEISEILNIPLGTIKSRIFNATKQLFVWFHPQSISPQSISPQSISQP
jgi:RNA polymerase sigma-70 factor (ECF subfamily)